MNRDMNVAVSFDEGYAEQATILLYSLLANNQDGNITVYAFYSDLNEHTKKRISANLSPFLNFTFCWMLFDKDLTQRFEIRKGHVNEYTYTRIFMPEMLNFLERVLYLDCDMVVLGNLADLWQTDLQNKTVAAVQDLSIFTRHADLMMPESTAYFNAGVLLIDVKKWRKKKYSEQVTDRLIQLGGKAVWWDQDGLNSILHNDWLRLPQRWNIQSHDVFLAQQKGIKNVRKYLTPKVVHFTGNLKPWNYKSSNPFKKDYYAYLEKTDFKQTHRPQNKTIVAVVRRTVRNVLVKVGLLKY